MHKRHVLTVSAASWILLASAALAGNIQVALVVETFDDIAEPENPFFHYTSYRLFATTDGDIQRIDNVAIQLSGGATLYNVPFGTDFEPPSPVFLAVFPQLEFDSWITTPGHTMGGSFMPGEPTPVWSDTTDDGPQTNFQFANLTLPDGVPGQFSFRIHIADPLAPGGVYSQDFTFAIPEPAAACLAALALPALRRRKGIHHRGR